MDRKVEQFTELRIGPVLVEKKQLITEDPVNQKFRFTVINWINNYCSSVSACSAEYLSELTDALLFEITPKCRIDFSVLFE